MEFTLKTRIKATSEEIYNAWLNSESHTEMTGGKATASDKIGDSFTAWDGYIMGENLVLVPFRRIVQSWRTTEFEEKEEDSKIELLLHEIDGETEITLLHTNVPEHGEEYITGWEEHYFQPMKEYF